MPLYDYKCPQCGTSCMDVFHSMNSPGPECDTCRVRMEKLISLPHTDLKEYHTPIELHSIACNSWEEIREIQDKCPDVDISDNPDDDLFGVPIARTRKAKLQALKAVGYRENN